MRQSSKYKNADFFLDIILFLSLKYNEFPIPKLQFYNIIILSMHLTQDSQEILSKKYIIKSLLGKGSFGNVYQCQEKQTGQIYAIKIISKLSVKKSKIDCLRQEATLMLSLDHPNIVKIYQFFQDDKVIFIKMEYIKNGTLGALMKEKELKNLQFSDDEVAEIMGSIFMAVNYIHLRSIIHRDIKPQNILIADKKQLKTLKIADFGLGAKLQMRATTATSKCGTYLFMAPQILWNYTYTKAVDVWSCAIIMFMLKKGHHPFFQPKMTNDQFKQKIKNIKFPAIQQDNPQIIIINSKSKSKSKKIHNDDKKDKKQKEKVSLAQDFMNRISKINPNQRYTAQQALKHPWLTRNFQDLIPLSLHDSFIGFQKSSQISHAIKFLLFLKNQNFKRQQMQVIVKKDFYKTYQNHCEEVNKKQRSVSPLKLRRLGSIKQTQNMCNLSVSNKVLSPQKTQQVIIKQKNENDADNPTIIKLNMIFNSLFDKKQKRPKKYSDDEMLALSLKTPKQYIEVQVPNIDQYKHRIQQEIRKAVQSRPRRKKERIFKKKAKKQFQEYQKYGNYDLKLKSSSSYQKQSSSNKSRNRRKFNSLYT